MGQATQFTIGESLGHTDTVARAREWLVELITRAGPSVLTSGITTPANKTVVAARAFFVVRRSALGSTTWHPIYTIQMPMPRACRHLIRCCRLEPWARRLCSCVLIFAAQASIAETWVITDEAHPVTNVAGARVIHLDAPTRIEAELSAQLPADPARAAAVAQKRLNQGGAALQRRLTQAHQGVVDAWSAGVTKLPAVVIDQRYIVYGQPDVARAVARVQQYRGGRP